MSDFSEALLGSVMRFGGKHRSWQIGVGDAETFLLGALWLRDVEHLAVPLDETVPGPVDADRLSPPSTDPADRPDLRREWLEWWHSIIDHAERPPLLPPDPSLEPAFDTPDPLGLARLPRLGAVAARRWTDYLEWRNEHYRDWRTRRTEPNPETGNVVRAVETELGRKLRPFELRFSLVPVRDDRILRVEPNRYLVPERVYGSARWPAWLRTLIFEVG